MARKAFLIAEALTRHKPDDPIDAAVLVWDTDDEQVERPRGVSAARDEARRWATFQIVCGFPDPEREAWVLAGFDACDPAEQQRLNELHRELGFSPVLHAVHPRDKTHGALRNIKRVRAAIRHPHARVGDWMLVAKSLRFARSTVTDMVYGRTPISASLAFRVARFLGGSIDDLLAGRFTPPSTCPYCKQPVPG